MEAAGSTGSALGKRKRSNSNASEDPSSCEEISSSDDEKKPQNVRILQNNYTALSGRSDTSSSCCSDELLHSEIIVLFQTRWLYINKIKKTKESGIKERTIHQSGYHWLVRYIQLRARPRRLPKGEKETVEQRISPSSSIQENVSDWSSFVSTQRWEV